VAFPGEPSARSAGGRYGCAGIAIGLGVVLLLLAAGVTAFCGRLPVISGVRYHEAYGALLPGEPALPPDSADLRRVLEANAAIEDAPPPAGLLTARRRHGPGTLARLRYEAFGGRGERVARWEVRALVPPLPGSRDASVDSSGLGRWECPAPCREGLERSRAVVLERSGDPGIPFEWILRMPIGRTFDLGARAVTTQDIMAAAPRRLDEPSRLSVTLVEACRGELRVGTLTRLEFSPNAIIPIPRRFSTVHWLQIAGCPSLSVPADEPGPDVRAVATPPATQSRSTAPPEPETRAAVARRDPRTGRASLEVDELWLERFGRPVLFRLVAICRYEPAEDRWKRVPSPTPAVTYRLLPRGLDDDRSRARPILELPAETALFWVRWTEATPYRERTAIMPSGSVLCNDVEIGTAPAGRVAACVPFPDRARALFIPAPPAGCDR
jgi:hypothetical protein